MTPQASQPTALLAEDWPNGWSVPRPVSWSTLPRGPCPSAVAMRTLALGYRSVVLPPLEGSFVGRPAVADADDEAWGGDESSVLGCACPLEEPGDDDEGRWIEAERERIEATFDPATGEPRPGTPDCSCVEERPPIGLVPQWRPFSPNARAEDDAEDERGPMMSADPADRMQDP